MEVCVDITLEDPMLRMDGYLSHAKLGEEAGVCDGVSIVNVVPWSKRPRGLAQILFEGLGLY